MTLDLSDYDTHECRNCLTARDVTRHADLFIVTYLCDDNRALVAHLLGVAADLMTAAQNLSLIFLHDGHHTHDGHNSHDGDTACVTGLTEVQRLQVLTLASTCAYNATLFVQEAQRRRIRRPVMGWDPITTPISV
jgi:hypothetical protein